MPVCCVQQELLGWTELKGFKNGGGHGVHQGHCVSHNVIPLRVMPCCFAALFSVCHGLVAPDVIDSVKLSQLCEKATVGNILSDAAPELDPLAPVVAPVIEAARLKAVRPDVINTGPFPGIRAWPEHEGLGQLARLLVDT